MARILITGITGFVGSHLADALSRGEHELMGIGRVERHIAANIDYHYTDLRDIRSVEIIRDFAPEIVYHLAANSVESSGEHSPLDMTTNGYNTFFNTLVGALQGKNLKKFIYVSSVAVYGNIRTPYTEEQQPHPNDIYAISKYANELSLQVMARTYGFSYVIARPHNITGERQDPTDPRRNVVTMFMQLLRLGRPPKIIGDGTSKRCYTYVGDVVDALVAAMGVDNVIFNIGSDHETTIQELYDKVREVTQIPIDPEYLPARTNEVALNTVSHTRAKELFALSQTPFHEVIQKTWDWVSRQPLEDFKSYSKEIDL